MTPTPSLFLQMFPTFNKPQYTDGLLDVWFNVALTQVNASRWGSMYLLGVNLLTAHYLTIYGDCDSQVGLLTSNTVDGVTYSLDVSLVTNEDGISFNASKYGVQFFQIAKIKGTGPLSSLASRSCYGH